MMDLLLVAVLSSLASWALLNAYFQANLFSGLRRRLQPAEAVAPAQGFLRHNANVAAYPFRKLLTCRYCLRHHLPFWSSLFWAQHLGHPLFEAACTGLAAIGFVYCLDETWPESIQATEPQDTPGDPVNVGSETRAATDRPQDTG